MGGKLKLHKNVSLSTCYGSTVDEFIDYLRIERDKILAIGGDNITIDINHRDSYYDEIETFIELNYQVEESDEEFEKRQEALAKAKVRSKISAAKAKKTKEEKERKEFERLKKKYAVQD